MLDRRERGASFSPTKSSAPIERPSGPEKLATPTLSSFKISKVTSNHPQILDPPGPNKYTRNQQFKEFESEGKGRSLLRFGEAPMDEIGGAVILRFQLSFFIARTYGGTWAF